MSKKTTIFVLVGLLVLNLIVVQSLAWRTGVFEQLDLLIDVRHEIVNEYVEVPDEKKMVDAAVKAMVESLGDPYTQYLPPEEMAAFEKAVRGTFSGIGAEIDIHNDYLRIVTPLEDSPAWESGVLAGDIVLEIEGESTEGITTTEAITKLTGEPGTDVTIKVRHLNGKEEKITITRQKIKIPTVKGFRKKNDNGWDFMIDDKNKVGYIRLTQFTDETTERLTHAIEQMRDAGVKGVILDLRFNPGGLLKTAVEVADMFLGGGENIVSVRGRAHADETYDATDDTLVADLPIAVLINEMSASASEIVSGSIKDNDRGIVIGTRSFGKGSVQQVKMLEANGGALKITNALYYLPSGRNIHRKEDAEVWGVDPNDGFYVPMSDDQMTEMLRIRRDPEFKLPEGTVTAEFLEKQMGDPQLAAALTTMIGKVNSGDWPRVGKEAGETLVRQAELTRLKNLRQSMTERINEVNERIAKLERGEPVPDLNGDAKEKQEEKQDD